MLGRELKIDLGAWNPNTVLDEIRESVGGYNIPLAVLATGGAAPAIPVNGHAAADVPPELIRSARDTLFTSGSLTRFSRTLNAVVEAPGKLYKEQP